MGKGFAPLSEPQPNQPMKRPTKGETGHNDSLDFERGSASYRSNSFWRLNSLLYSRCHSSFPGQTAFYSPESLPATLHGLRSGFVLKSEVNQLQASASYFASIGSRKRIQLRRSWAFPHHPPTKICHSDQRDGAFGRPGAEETLCNVGFQVYSAFVLSGDIPCSGWIAIRGTRCAGGRLHPANSRLPQSGA